MSNVISFDGSDDFDDTIEGLMSRLSAISEADPDLAREDVPCDVVLATEEAEVTIKELLCLVEQLGGEYDHDRFYSIHPLTVEEKGKASV